MFSNHPTRLTLAILVALTCSLTPAALAKGGTGDTSLKPIDTIMPEAKGPATPTEKALEEYNQGVELFKIGQNHANKGNNSGQEKLLKEAIKHFDAAVKLKPDFVEAQSNIGFSYLTLKKYNQATDAFKKALQIKPKHLNSLNGLATTYAINEKPAEALATFNELTTLSPNQADYWFNQGAVQQKIGHYKDAEASYQEALKVSPHHQRTLFNLGTLKENQSAYEEALQYYEKAKGSDIGNTIGLEAMKRIEAIKQALATSQGPPDPSKK